MTWVWGFLVAKFVALLRGVNVGGHNKVPMADLRRHVANAGLWAPRSYLASGNLMFEAEGTEPELALRLNDILAQNMSVQTPVLVIEANRFRAMVRGCPFAPDDPRHVHAAFFMGQAKPDHELVAKLSLPGDQVVFAPGIMWVHTPGGFGRSKLGAAMERLAGTDVTARNLRTVINLVEMLDAGASA